MSHPEFNQLLTGNSDFLKPVAINLTRDPEDAADLYQETLFRALVNREKYNVGTSIKAWLSTIMRNLFINNYRRKVKQNLISNNSSDDAALENLDVPAANTSEGLLEVKHIQEAIHKLPKIFRQPVVLYFEGYKYHDISRILHEPLGTIKSRIHFARKILKSQLQRY